MIKQLKNHKEKIIGLIISIIFIILILWNLDFKQLIDTFKVFNYKILLFFVPLYILSLYIRGIRWKYILCNDKKLTIKESFFSFTTGNTLNSYLPARAGDFWRAYHVGTKIKESKMKILGSIILERIIDGISVLLLLLFAVFTYFKHKWAINLAEISSALFIGSFVILYVIYKFVKIDSIFEKLSNIPLFFKFKIILEKTSEFINKFMEGFSVLNNPKYLFAAFLLSCCAWSIECLLTYMLISGFGMHFAFSAAFFVISFLALSTVIPSSSIFVGPYQYAYILALGIYHIDKSNALGIAFIHQFVIMATITAISILYFTMTNTTLNDIQSEIEKTEEYK